MNVFKWKNFIIPLNGIYLSENILLYFIKEFEKMLKNSFYSNEKNDNLNTISFNNEVKNRESYERLLLHHNKILNIEQNMYAFIFKLEFTDNTIRSITDLLFFNFKKDINNEFNIDHINKLLIGIISSNLFFN